jgi:hypothetical protein
MVKVGIARHLELEQQRNAGASRSQLLAQHRTAGSGALDPGVMNRTWLVCFVASLCGFAQLAGNVAQVTRGRALSLVHVATRLTHSARPPTASVHSSH